MTGRFVHERPLRVYWEVTRACDLACRHCRADASPDCHPDDLTTAEAERLLDQLAALGIPFPHVVFTGGDPLKRTDLFTLIAAGRERGLPISVAPSATALLTSDALRRLRQAGVSAISLSLDGPTAAHHDSIRGFPGTWERTVQAAQTARAIGLPFQINTLVCAETADALPAIYRQVAEFGAARWSLFFLVTVGRGRTLRPITPAHAEDLLSWAAALAPASRKGGPVVTTTEAPHLRRVAIERRRAGHDTAPKDAGRSGRPPAETAGIRDGNGILFISHTGEVCPSGFLEISAGNVRRADVGEIYRTAPLFQALRDADQFRGRCGRCEYRWVCGGSRARAFAASGDPLGEDPLCAYEPRRAGALASAP